MKMSEWDIDEKTGVASTQLDFGGCLHKIELPVLFDAFLNDTDPDAIANRIERRVKAAKEEHDMRCKALGK